MEKKIVSLNGRLVEFDGNKPVRVLSRDEEDKVRMESTTQYKASKLSNRQLLLELVKMINAGYRLHDDFIEEHKEKVMTYLAEILSRMDKKFNFKDKSEMRVTKELSLSTFDFWGGAKERAKMLTTDELNEIESQLEDLYPDGIGDTQINDIFWFDFDWIAQMLGYEDEEDFYNKRN